MKYAIIMFFSFLTAVVLGSFFAVLIIISQINKPPETFQRGLANDVTTHINKYRESINLPDMKENPIVCDLATSRSMEASGFFSHNGFFKRFDDPEYGKYIEEAEYRENVSRLYSTGEEVVNAWIKSYTHKQTLDSHFDYGCVVCYKGTCILNTVRLIEE